MKFILLCYNNQHKMFSPYLESNLFLENSCSQSKVWITSKNMKTTNEIQKI